MHRLQLVHVACKLIDIDLLQFENTYDEFVADITKYSSVALSTEFFETAWAAAMIMVIERCIKLLVPFERAGSLDERPSADGTAV